MRKIAMICAVALGGMLLASGNEFVLLTDIHTVEGNPNVEMTKGAIEEINRSDASFVLISGDLTNTGSVEELRFSKSLIDKLEKPVYVIPGNHETTWNNEETYKFPEIFGSDRFIFREGKYVFAGIPSGPWFKMGDGYIRRADIAWLESELAKRVRPGDMVIFVCHYPLNMDLSNAEDVLAVLKKYQVIAILSGHYHEIRHFNTDGINNITGRAVSLRHSREKSGGYNVVTLDKGRLKLYNKVVGSELPSEPQIDVSLFSGNAEIGKTGETVKFRCTENRPMPPEMSFAGQGEERIDTGAWRNWELGRVQAKPAERDGIIAFGAWDTNLYVFDASSGKLKWSWNNGSPQILLSPGNVTPVIGESNIAIVAPDRYLTIFNRDSGNVVWRTNIHKFRESISSSSDGHSAYAKTMDGELVIINVDKPEIVNVIDLGLGYEHTPVPPFEAFGSVFVGGRQGDLVRVDLASGDVRWSYRCGNSAFDSFEMLPDNTLSAKMIDGKEFIISH